MCGGKKRSSRCDVYIARSRRGSERGAEHMRPQSFCLWQMRFHISVKKIRILMLLILTISLSLSVLGRALAQPLFSPTQDPTVGSRIFGAKGCSKCHAIGGVGAKLGPDLGRVSTPRSFYDLAAAMWNHLPQMSKKKKKIGISRPQLSPGETGDLIAFL